MLELKENQRVFLETLRPNPRNYRVHPESQIKILMESLNRFGQARSIVCQAQEDGTYLLVAGHGVFQAARRLGYKQLRADILPKEWSQEMVSGFLLSENKTRDHGYDDLEQMLSLLQEQQTVDLASLGASESEIRALLETVAFAPPEEPKKEILKEQPKEPRKPKVTHYEPVQKTPEPEEEWKPEPFEKIQQIVLIYAQDEYRLAMTILSHIRTKHGLDSTTDSVTYLLNEYATAQGLASLPLEREQA